MASPPDESWIVPLSMINLYHSAGQRLLLSQPPRWFGSATAQTLVLCDHVKLNIFFVRRVEQKLRRFQEKNVVVRAVARNRLLPREKQLFCDYR